jgi:hypothetical protein
MSVETAPLPEAQASPTAASLLTAIAALVAVVALVWAIGSATGNGSTATNAGNVNVAAGGGAHARTTPATFDRLNTPVGHHGEHRVQYADLPKQTQAQLDVVRKIIERYPTAADAERAGWHRATTNLKGIAAHYLRGGVGGFLNIDGTFNVNDPEILLFDGETPAAPVVGVAYLVNGATPEGFAGKWDSWHRHEAVCFAGGYVIGEIGGAADSEINMTAAGCKAQRGISFPLSNLALLHVWMKPGFASANGVFSHSHPRLT